MQYISLGVWNDGNPKIKDSGLNLTKKDGIPRFNRGSLYLLMEDYVYYTHWGDRRVIPAGLKFDGVSRPWILEGYIPQNSPDFIPYLKHDDLYAKQDFDRYLADVELLIDLIKNQDNSKVKALGEYYVLRVKGMNAWKENKKMFKKHGLEYFYMSSEYLLKIKEDIKVYPALVPVVGSS